MQVRLPWSGRGRDENDRSDERDERYNRFLGGNGHDVSDVAQDGFLVGATLLLSACAGYGPTTISRDRFDYTAAISDSWKHQMLFNMVKIRYGDAPVFMDVTSVISQYQIAGQINLGCYHQQQPLEQLGESSGRWDNTWTARPSRSPPFWEINLRAA